MNRIIRNLYRLESRTANLNLMKQKIATTWLDDATRRFATRKRTTNRNGQKRKISLYLITALTIGGVIIERAESVEINIRISNKKDKK